MLISVCKFHVLFNALPFICNSILVGFASIPSITFFQCIFNVVNGNEEWVRCILVYILSVVKVSQFSDYCGKSEFIMEILWFPFMHLHKCVRESS